ncbi:MAG: hypothetical protein IKU98_07385 [Bacteroidaceae bacterium]|nr:hypothetical protein [Bacteroidaceae bacterium]
MRRIEKLIALCMLMVASTSIIKAEVDPNFYVYLCFGQSNMEGNAQWEAVDSRYVDPRFQMLATTDFDNPKRSMGTWYTANCPIVSPVGKLGMADYFGRTMVAALPSDVKVGVVAVAMGGSPIEMFDKYKYSTKLAQNPNEWWAILAKNYYGGKPYQRLVDMGKKAQEKGVIKGILLHQGCSNNGDPNWPSMVKTIYNNLLADLGLVAEDVPLFVGETLQEDQGGACYGHNTVIAQMPQTISTSYIVRSNGCPGNGEDPWHFSAAGYRTMGKRYAQEALKAMKREVKQDTNYTMPDNLKNFYTLTSIETNEVRIKVNEVASLTIWGTFADGHKEDLTREVSYSSADFIVSSIGRIKATSAKSGTVTITYNDFMGTQHTVALPVVATGESTYQFDKQLLSVSEMEGKSFLIYNEEEGKAFYGPDNQNLGYDVLSNVFQKSNAAICFKAEPTEGYYLLRAITPAGAPYSIWGNPGYLNSQDASGWCSFILGLNGQNGQDLKDGALWDIQYVDGKGFTLRNIGTGKYLYNAAPAMYDEPTYFSFYTIKESGASSIELPMAESKALNVYYDLSGRRVTHPSKGIYILNGKKVVVN